MPLYLDLPGWLILPPAAEAAPDLAGGRLDPQSVVLLLQLQVLLVCLGQLVVKTFDQIPPLPSPLSQISLGGRSDITSGS